MSLLFLDTEFRSELDIGDVGHYKYLNHHSTELLMVAFAFGNEDVELWEPRFGPMPERLRKGLEDYLQIIVAWNCSFERVAFRKHLGLDIPIDRFEDPMIRSRYMSMPGSQDKVGKILDIEFKKLKEKARGDESIISFFCTPLKYGGTETLFGIEPTTYRDYDTHPRQWEMFQNRCMIDVEGMREILNRLSKFPLPDFEYELFGLNEEINDRGIYTDSVLLQGATLIVDKEFESLRKEFVSLTGVSNPRSNPSVLAYVKSHGYTFPSIGKQFVNRALAGECNLDEDGKKALKLRLQLSKSSVAKLEACRNAVETDGRVRGLFNFMGAARTARWTSGLVQVQNLVKATKEIEKKYELALRLLRAGDYEGIKSNFSSPIDVACSALRPIFRAETGRKFVIADLAAIESRGAGWVAGCETLMQVFRDGRDPYLSFAVQMDPTRTYEELEAAYKAGDKITRTYAKAPTLGCFGKHTLVVTSKGLKPITKITREDELWDGEEWVKSDGILHQGYKETIDLFGVSVTSDHKILTGNNEWRNSWELVNTLYGRKAIRLANGSFKQAAFDQSEVGRNSTICVNAPAEKSNGFTNKILSQVNRIVAMGVLENEKSRRETEFIRGLMLLEKSFIALRTDIIQSYPDAGVSENLLTAIEVAGLSASSEVSMSSWNTVCLFQIIISLVIKLIERIITGIMKKEISDLCPVQSMEEIKKHLDLLNTKEKDYLPWSFESDIVRYTGKLQQCVEKFEREFLQNRLLQSNLDAVEATYDIKNSGPRNRYTIVTKKGPMIVHNCGYGLTPGEITQDEDGNIVKTGLLAYAANMGIELPIEYAIKAVQVFRNTYQEIVQFWYALHEAFITAVEKDEVAEIGPLVIEKKGRVVCIWLPSGRALHYINPEVIWTERISSRTGRKYKASEIIVDGIDQETHQWGRIKTYGSKIFENVVQAICRDILGCGMIRARDMGFPIVLTCHDEIVAEVLEDSHLGVKELVEAMTAPIDWAKGFLIGAEGFETAYYTKE